MSRRGTQAQRSGPDTATAAHMSHGDTDPAQNEARTSPRLCLLEVTSDSWNINHHLPAHRLYQKQYAGHGVAAGEAASLSVYLRRRLLPVSTGMKSFYLVPLKGTHEIILLVLPPGFCT